MQAVKKIVKGTMEETEGLKSFDLMSKSEEAKLKEDEE